MRRKVIAGNWKMNKNIHETASLIQELKERLKDFGNPSLRDRNEVEVVICPPYTSLVIAKSLIKDSPLKLGAQNMWQHNDGAYTGEISAAMLTAIGCEYVILGHSERRQYFKEIDELINAKVKRALKAELTPIICIGETLEERESDITAKIITAQVKGVLHELSSEEVEKCIIAYEPVWAIGTGKNATPDQANQVHKLIRKLVGQLYSWAVAEKIIIQYGGSMNAQNAADLLSESDIDGGLIGGASLKSDTFMAIIQAGVEAKL
ncbi:MAG TPA: triose-phosphate isomerase [Bacteroidota bacterium]|nr:triose-phosphate isomerase [Bacteroidota bacterium]